MPKKILIRADGNSKIGIGHISRCIHFIENIKEPVDVFFCIKKNAQIREYLFSKNYKVHEIDPKISLNEEINSLLEFSSDFLILDLRNKPDLYYRNCAESFKKVLRFDDSATKISIYSTLYLNYNLYSENIDYDVRNKECSLFLGPKYYILNPIFKDYYNYSRSFRSEAKNILITMGGGDPKNLTIKIANAIINLKNIHLNIILGKLFEGYDEIKNLKTKAPDKISIFKNVDNMPEMMAKNEIIIGTGGNTSFEAAYMGIAGILINQIDLQAKNAAKYEEKGVFKTGGLGENLSQREIRDIIKDLILDAETRKELSNNGKNLNISKGIESVIEKFII